MQNSDTITDALTVEIGLLVYEFYANAWPPCRFAKKPRVNPIPIWPNEVAIAVILVEIAEYGPVKRNMIYIIKKWLLPVFIDCVEIASGRTRLLR